MHGETGKQAQNKQHLLADMQNVLAKHEMFEEIGGGETSKQVQEVESVSCQANNVSQFRQALTIVNNHMETRLNDPSDRERSPTIIWKPGLKV